MTKSSTFPVDILVHELECRLETIEFLQKLDLVTTDTQGQSPDKHGVGNATSFTEGIRGDYETLTCGISTRDSQAGHAEELARAAVGGGCRAPHEASSRAAAARPVRRR